MNVPWINSPDETFLSREELFKMKDKNTNAFENTKYSLVRLEAFHKVYMKLYDKGRVTPPGSRWYRDN